MWTPVVHLLAAVVNLLHAGNRMHAGKKTKQPLIQSPQPARQKRRMSVASVRTRALELTRELN
jgi:hypothetical protein